MSKIRIAFYACNIDYAGTWRSHERIIKYLDDKKFDSSVIYWEDQGGSSERLKIVKNIYKNISFISFKRSPERPRENGYSPLHTNFNDVVGGKFDIIHFARSGYYEWPFTSRLAPIQVETNIFGFRDNSPFLDKSIAISEHVRKKRRGSDAVIYNGIPKPVLKGDSFRNELGIDKNTIVLGRIGRPDPHLFTSIALDAYKIIKDHIGDQKVVYIIFAPCEKTKKYIAENNIRDVYFLPPTARDDIINKFYRTLDIFAHYRRDGETFGVGIAHAMMYKMPIVSHRSATNNAHIETIGQGGAVVSTMGEYAEVLSKMILDKEIIKEKGRESYKRAIENFEEEKISKKFQSLYTRWLGEV